MNKKELYPALEAARNAEKKESTKELQERYDDLRSEKRKFEKRILKKDFEKPVIIDYGNYSITLSLDQWGEIRAEFGGKVDDDYTQDIAETEMKMRAIRTKIDVKYKKLENDIIVNGITDNSLKQIKTILEVK